MGLFKKIFRPVSKVLDKIVPNEIKPLLPYVSAFAPYMLPGNMAFGSGIMSNPMIARALASGGINALSQLSQEGNEGDLNALSLGLASLQGGMGADGAADKFRSYKDAGKASYTDVARGNVPGMSGGYTTQYDPSTLSFLDKAKNIGLEGLAKGSEFIGDAGDVLRPEGKELTMKNIIQSAGVPFSLGTGDVMRYEADEAMKAYEEALAAYNSEQGQFGNDDGRRTAIMAAMEAYNHPTELIESTLEELGLKEGGRVGYNLGGGITDIFEEEVFSKPDFGGVEKAVGNIAEENELLASRQRGFFMLLEEAIGKNDLDKIQEIKSDWFKEFGIEMPMTNNTLEEQPIMAAQGGMMSVLPQGMEMDYRQGGMIPMGSKEKADDVPARVSKNEFVMTADAVRAAGGGSVNQGAKRMYELMNNLEARA